MFGPNYITQEYIRRYGRTRRVKEWENRRVNIQTDNGTWRIGGQGYTSPFALDAWVIPFKRAESEISHCGPEKQGTFILARGQAPVVMKRKSRAKSHNKMLIEKNTQENRMENGERDIKAVNEFLGKDGNNQIETEYHPSVKETVVYLVDDGLETYMSSWADDGTDKEGFATCEMDNGYLKYMLLADMKDPPMDGWYALTNATVEYTYNSYFMEHDCDLVYSKLRPAKTNEIKKANGLVTIRDLYNQARLHTRYVFGFAL